MVKKRMLAAIVGIALIVGILTAPRAARASDVFTISLLVAGGIAVVGVIAAVVAIAGTHEDEPHFLVPQTASLPRRDERTRSGVQIGLQCKTPDGGPALLCW